MKAYKKRMKGSWNQGKGCKGDGEERQFAKREIKAELAAAEETFLEKYRKGRRHRNMRARLEHRINWYQERLKSCSDWFASYCRSELKKDRVKLAELIEKEKRCATQ